MRLKKKDKEICGKKNIQTTLEKKSKSFCKRTQNLNKYIINIFFIKSLNHNN